MDTQLQAPRFPIVLAVLLSVMVAACSQTAAPPAAPRDESLHALMVDRIDTLRRRIEILTFDQNRTPVELDQARQRESSEVAYAARELAASVVLLDQASGSLGLSPQEQAQFRALASELRNASEELARVAVSPNAEFGPALIMVQQSCEACHALYRDR